MIFWNLKRIFKFLTNMTIVFGALFIDKIAGSKVSYFAVFVLSLGSIVYFLSTLSDTVTGIHSIINLISYPFIKYKISKNTKEFNKRYFPIKIEYTINKESEIGKIVILESNRKYELDLSDLAKNNMLFFKLKIKKDSLLYS